VAAVKVFWQNTTRSETRCGDCGKNTKCSTFTALSVELCWPPYLCWIFYFLSVNILLKKYLFSLGIYLVFLLDFEDNEDMVVLSTFK
jgi:hypothetical protein